MRIELPGQSERFGANVFYAPLQVYELDAGLYAEPEGEQRAIIALPYERLYELERRLAVVIPVRKEPIRVIEGVLFGIPNQCLVIVVSNSPREPVDRFRVEQHAIARFSRVSRKRVILVHQKDPMLARAFREAGYPDLLGEDGLVRDGKGEGMIVAMVLAHLAGKGYVGFVDADNYSPGAVNEYVREYAAGFVLAKTDYAMVRILWQSKPKIVDGLLYFAKWGRTSRVTNRFLNELIGRYTGFETDVIRTGNAGEHALTVDLALRLEHGTGYSIEPQQIVSLLERFGGVRESPHPQVMREGVEIFQVESRNPHFHESGEKSHVDHMTRVALASIHTSFICPQELRREIEDELRRQGTLGPGASLGPIRRYPPLVDLDFSTFRDVAEERLQTASFDPVRPGGPGAAGGWPGAWRRRTGGGRFPGNARPVDP